MHLTRALVPFLTLSFLTSAAPSSSNLYIREAEAKTSTEISDPLIPPSWLSQRSPLGLIALGDDGVLRNLRLRIPSTPQRHDHLNPARHEVLAAISLSPLQIKHFVDKAPLNDKAKLHFHQFFTGVNGHDVQRKGLMAPDPKLLPRSPGTVAQARVMKERALNEEREEGGLVERQLTCNQATAYCHDHSDCRHLGLGCFCGSIDHGFRGVFGECVDGERIIVWGRAGLG